MENLKSYIVSFGDSDKYVIKYAGSKSELEGSEIYRSLVKTVTDFVKGRFPEADCGDLVKVEVVEDKDTAGYKELDKVAIDDLLQSVARQIEVMREGKELNLNAPFDEE